MAQAEGTLRGLFSKQGFVTTQLAFDLLQYSPGTQIPKAQEYGQRYRVGLGTVQAALQQLQDAGAVKLVARGHLGTFLESVSYPRLWHFTLRGPLVGCMPLPYSRRYEGLATGLHELFSEAGVSLNLTFVRGSLNRVEALAHGRCDFVVMSKLALDNAASPDGDDLTLAPVCRFGPGSWIGDYVVVLRNSSLTSIRSGMRVGIDSRSVDHTIVVKLACRGQRVEFVSIGYMQLRSALASGHIDATVWNKDDFATHPEPNFRIISAEEAGLQALRDTYSEAVIVVSSDQRGVANLVGTTLDVEKVMRVQQQVLTFERLPSY